MSAMALLANVTGAVRRVSQDTVYRGSTLLLVNSALLSGFGFVFWFIAARMYPTADVGVFSGIMAAVGLFTVVATLGMQNTLMRRLATSPAPRQLALAAVVTTLIGGGILCLIAISAFGRLLPESMEILGTEHQVFIGLLALATAVGSVTVGGLVAVRASHAVVTTNLAGSAVKVTALLLLALGGVASVYSLVAATAAGACLATGGGLLVLFRLMQRDAARVPRRELLRQNLSFSTGNYLASIVGILPSTVVPLMVLSIAGKDEAAYFAIAFTLAGFLNFVPAATGQVLMAEASRGDRPLRMVVGKSIRHVYAFVVPGAVILGVLAPEVLRIFGANYAAGATTCLRLLCLGALATGCTYLIDAVLLARDRVAGYMVINAANAALVLVFVGLAVPYGLTAVGAAWVTAQTLSVGAGVVILWITGVWSRDAARTGGTPSGGVIGL